MLNPGAVGLHIIESFVSAVPLITLASARHGPEFEYIEHPRNAWVVERADAELIAKAAYHVLTTPTLLSQMRDQCRGDAARYTLENMVDHFANGVVDCLREHGHKVDPKA